MTETNESYEDLVKQLKPLSVVLDKISDEKYATLKIVDDPNRIKDEVIHLSVDDNQEEEEEIEMDLTEAEANANKEAKESDSRRYSCFFCQKELIGYNEAMIHFQLHIDYFPIQCSICDEAITHIMSFVKHCRSTHPELQTAKYIRKYNSIYFNWIHNFLTSEPNSCVKSSIPYKYCPACDWLKLVSPSEETTSIKSLPIIRHIHEHIQYQPFSCIKCRESGNEFRVFALDREIRNHCTTEHKELEPPFWKHFGKQYSIPCLDKFIANYLHILGIKIPKHRNRSRRTKPKTDPLVTIEGQTSQPIVLSNSSVAIPPKAVPMGITSIPMVTNQNLMVPINTTQLIPQTFLNNGNLLITYTKPQVNPIQQIQPQVNYLQMENPMFLLPSNNRINYRPIPIESTDLGIICVDPEMVAIDDKYFEYICVFCDEEKVFKSEIEMSVHMSIHFSYYPVICMLCEQSFLDFSTLICHYVKRHKEYQNNIFHYLKEDEKIEKWIQSFVSYQKTHPFRGNVSVTYGDYCFVCQKLSKNETSFRMKCDKRETKAIRQHINQHLHYYPYKCLICFHGNRMVRFSALNVSAVTHINKIHNLSLGRDPSDPLYYSKLIVKTEEIIDLEKFIDSKLFPKREDSLQPKLVLNLKRKLNEILESKKSSESLPSAQVLPIVRQEYFTDVRSSSSDNKNTLTQTLNKTLISLLKPNSSPQKPLNGINTVRAHPLTPKPKPIEYIPTKNTYIEPFLLCFHCHQKVLNTNDLEIHHKTKHPKLTIASYAPTRRDLTGSMSSFNF